MATFDTPTPTPILTVLELGAGTVRIDAQDRTDTVVTVRPATRAVTTAPGPPRRSPSTMPTAG